MTRQWFISDLHLALERPQTLRLFEEFIASEPAAGDRLFILGDLFDAWIGDDDDSELATRVRQALRAAVDRGVEVLIQRGNRDFLIGRRLMEETGARLLPDLYVTEVAGQPTLLMHGDLLCTDDLDYQRARRRFRNPLFQWLMLRRSLAARRRVAEDYRRRSREATSGKAAEIMDANEDTVREHLLRHGVRQLIHGHTHRPALHNHPLPDGTAARRIVLPEWHAEGTEVWVDDGAELTSRPLKTSPG
jgi:UDP-2,3-diacylglucosamine hydrolase